MADDVLWTKLHVPVLPRKFVARPRLAAQLGDGFERPGIFLLCAPAGFGKTVLLADACARSGRPTAWLALDQHDNDPVRFWRHVAASLESALGDSHQILDAVEEASRGSAEPTHEAMATALVNAIPPEHGDVTLVLDDYHVIESERVHASVRYFLQRAPVALRIAIASRADPPLQLARRRAQGTLTEVRAAELRFTTIEGTELLRDIAAVEITDAVAALLTNRTEGWAAGLQLAALSLDGGVDVEAFAASFTGAHRYVLDYLAEEVLDRQPPAVRDFLVQTSVLDRLCGGLCDAVTGRADGQQMLEAIEAANLFLAPLDDVRAWWRYHQLFADLLRVRLDQEPPDRIVELHRRAGEWHEAGGQVNDAIGHALAAEDLAWAARLIEQHADELLLSRQGATLQRWFERIPSELDSRRLTLAQARIAIYGGQVQAAEDLLDRADRIGAGELDDLASPETAPVLGPLTDLDPMSTLLRAFVAHWRGDADTATALAADVLDDVDETSMVGLIARWHLATGPWLRGSAHEAEPAVATNIEAWRTIGEHDRAAWSVRYLGQIQAVQGRLDTALAAYQAVLDRDTEEMGPDAPAVGVAHVGLAEIAYQRNDLDTARVHARLGISKCGEFVYTQAPASGWLTMAKVCHAVGDADGARRAMARALHLAPDNGAADLLNPVPAQMAHLALLQGDLRNAERWVASRDPSAGDELRYVDEPGHLTVARVLLAQARPDAALHRLDGLRALAIDDGRHGSLIEIEVLRASALAATGDESGALRALTNALALGSAEGYVRVFVDEGRPLATLLARLASAPPDVASPFDSGYLDTLIGACGLGPALAADTSAGHRGLVVPLTDRELEVLVEIAAGRPNKEIAETLFISLNTVKKHVSHVFDKLGVTNRTAAVTRARELGLLP